MEKLDQLPNGWPIWQANNEFKFTLDAVLLAAFPFLRDNLKVVELGCGTGAVSLLLAARSNCQIVALDINEKVIELFQRSIILNNLTERVTSLHCDVNNIKSVLPGGSYDLVVSNPPYRKVGQGRLRNNGAISACHETMGQTVDFIKAAKYLLKYSGKFVMVHLPERLPEIMADCLSSGLQPKRLQFVQGKQDKEPSVFLLECVYGGKPGLKVLPALIVYDESNNYTQEVLACYNF